MKLWAIVGAIILVFGATPLPCWATSQPPPSPVRNLAQNADVIVCGTFGPRTRNNPIGQPEAGFSVSLNVSRIVRDHPARAGQMHLSIGSDVDSPGPNCVVIVFFTAKEGRLAYSGHRPVSSEGLIAYVEGFLNVKGKSRNEQKTFFFAHLDHTDPAVAKDSLQELDRYGDMEWATQLPAPIIAQRLKDPKTSPRLISLYAWMLGYCGDPKTHGDLIRELLNQADKREMGHLTDMMIGYTLLQPKEGWQYLKTVLADEKADANMKRHAVSALAHLGKSHPDVLNKQQVLHGMKLILTMPKHCGTAIVFLRESQQWDMADAVLDLFGNPAFVDDDTQMLILHFAHDCPSQRAQALFFQQRQFQPRALARFEGAKKAGPN